MKRKEHIDKIIKYLSRFPGEVELFNANALFDINIYAEYFLIPVLDIIFNTKLENANAAFSKNYPAVDLVDKKKRVAFQVTSTSDVKKVKHTLEKFREHELHKEYDTLYVLLIKNKVGKYTPASIAGSLPAGFHFNPEEHIIDIAKLVDRIKSLPHIKDLEKLAAIAEQEFSDTRMEERRTKISEPQKRTETLVLSADKAGFFMVDTPDEEVEFIFEVLLKNRPAHPINDLLTIEIKDEKDRRKQLEKLQLSKALKDRQEVLDTERELNNYGLMKEMMLFKTDFLLHIRSAVLTVRHLESYRDVLKQVVSFHSLNYNLGIYSGIPDKGMKIDIYTKMSAIKDQSREFVFSVYLNNQEFSETHKHVAGDVSEAVFFNSLRFKEQFILLNFFSNEIVKSKVIPSLVEAAYSYYRDNKEQKDYLFSHCTHLSNYFVGQG